MSEEIEKTVSLNKLRNKAMGLEEVELNEDEQYAYDIYINGYKDGVNGVTCFIKSLPKTDKEQADSILAGFVKCIKEPEEEEESEIDDKS